MKLNLRASARATVAIFLVGTAVSAQSMGAGRNVVINGLRMESTQLASLDQIHCMAIPDGYYFLAQVGTGAWAWGYAALPGIVQGYLGEECQTSQSGGGGSPSGSFSNGWSDDYSRTYGGGISAGDGTYEYYDGATGSFNYD